MKYILADVGRRRQNFNIMASSDYSFVKAWVSEFNVMHTTSAYKIKCEGIQSYPSFKHSLNIN